MAQQNALERGNRNPLYPKGTLAASGTSPIELGIGLASEFGELVDAFTIDAITTLNGGTLTAGTLTCDVSNDGVHWVDSGITGVALATTDGGYVILAVNKFTTAGATKMPVRYARARLAGVTFTGAPTIDIALSA